MQTIYVRLAFINICKYKERRNYSANLEGIFRSFGLEKKNDTALLEHLHVSAYSEACKQNLLQS